MMRATFPPNFVGNTSHLINKERERESPFGLIFPIFSSCMSQGMTITQPADE